MDLTSEVERAAVLPRPAGVATTALVVTEGLLVYLTHEQVASLARALHAERSIHWWITNIASPLLLRMSSKSVGAAVKAGNAPFRFGLDDRPAFFQPLGWREQLFRSGWDEARRLRREMRMSWLMRFVMRFQSRRRRDAIRAMNGYLLLERA